MEMIENPMDTLKQAGAYVSNQNIEDGHVPESRDRKHNRRSALDDYVRSGKKNKRERRSYEQPETIMSTIPTVENPLISTDRKLMKASTKSKPPADETPEERALRK